MGKTRLSMKNYDERLADEVMDERKFLMGECLTELE